MTNQTLYSTPESEEYYFDEGCFILEVLNDAEHKELSIARARVAPNTETKLHALNKTTEYYLIISGTGIANINSEEINVSSNDVIVIKQGAPQKIKNTGDTDLVFFAICTPRFKPESYKEV